MHFYLNHCTLAVKVLLANEHQEELFSNPYHFHLFVFCISRCKKCTGLLRPHVVWFGESLEPDVLAKASAELQKCDLCLVVSEFPLEIKTGPVGKFDIIHNYAKK